MDHILVIAAWVNNALHETNEDLLRFKTRRHRQSRRWTGFARKSGLWVIFKISCFAEQGTIHEVTRSVTKHLPFFVQFRVTSWIVLFALTKESTL
jgi:hypothetical protein